MLFLVKLVMSVIC